VDSVNGRLPQPTDTAAGRPLRDASLGWAGVFRERPWLGALVGLAAVFCALAPFALTDPTPYFGMPGALATAITIFVAVTAGRVPGVITAAGAGAFFVAFVANPPHPISGPVSVATAVVWVVVAFVAGTAADGLWRRLASSFADVEARELRLQGALESTAAAVGLFSGPSLLCEDANARMRGLFSAAEWRARPLAALLPALPVELLEELRACAVSAAPEVRRDEVTVSGPDGESAFAVAAACRAGSAEPLLYLTLTDVTAAVRRRQDAERVLAIFSGVALAAGPAQVASELCGAAIGLFGCSTTSFWSVDGEIVSLLARAPSPVAEDRWTLEELADLGDVVRTGEPLFVDDVHDHYRNAPGREHSRLRTFFSERGYRSLLCLPVAYGAQIGALLFFAWVDPIERPDEELLAVARRFADETAIAIERAERLAVEREAARLHRRLEESLLPKVETRSDRLAAEYRYLPGERHLLIGGDFLDIAQPDDGSFWLIIGDVSGHGPDAAALGAMLRASWHALALQTTPLAELLALLDQVLVAERSDDGQFATVCVARLDPDGGLLTFALAGHPAPLLVGANGVAEVTGAHGLPLGVADDAGWPLVSAALPADWALLFYTDGLVDGFAPAGGRSRLGLRGLLALLEEVRPAGRAARSRQFAGRHLDALLNKARAGGRPAPDDLAILLVRPTSSARAAGATTVDAATGHEAG
jgi:serine phosphatase RsbU (regulator of sigma subunit)